MSTTSSRADLDFFEDSMFASGEELLNSTTNNGNADALSPGKQLAQPDAFATQLTRMQEEQVAFQRRIEREKKRKELLDENLAEIKQMLREMQDKTNNGNITMTNDVQNRKLIARLEYQLQTSKIKLSTARNDNTVYKAKVEDLRREKMLQLQILSDLHNESSAARRRSKYCAKEIQNINEKKHKVKMQIGSIKQKMVREMEDFSKEIDKAKQAISQTQVSILNTIRDKLAITTAVNIEDIHAEKPPTQPSSPTTKSPGRLSMSLSPHLSVWSPGRPFSQLGATSSQGGGHGHGTHPLHLEDQPANTQEIEALLRETEFKTVYELLTALQQSEESIFTLYHDTQARHEEVEKMELENKHLETKVQEQMRRLQVLEGNQEQVKLELEQSIQLLNTQMAKYDNDYALNMDILHTIRDPLLSVLKNVAIDEEALDQQLLSTGINDRNILDFLAIIEQRIDELIQMVKAANHQPIRKEDFMRVLAANGGPAHPGATGFAVPVPPSMENITDEEDEMLYNDENNKGITIQPLNIGVLKDLIMKKLQQKATLPNPSNPLANPLATAHLPKKHGSYASSSHHMSSASLSSEH